MRNKEIVTLANVNNGAAVVLFERDWQKVLNNIADESTPADAKREITMKFTIVPSKKRGGNAVVVISSALKLAAQKEAVGITLIEKDLNGVHGFVSNPRQEVLFPKEEDFEDDIPGEVLEDSDEPLEVGI